MKILKRILTALALTAGLFGAAHSQTTTASTPVEHICESAAFNPMSDVDWNYMYPITIAGAIMGTQNGPPVPLMAMMPPVCVCPTWFGFTMTGIGITYWSPNYLYEVERRPGCSTSTGGSMVLSGYGLLHSEQSENHLNQGKGANRMQIHYYHYPLFSMIEGMAAVNCHQIGDAGIGYMTEFDTFWQNDEWGAIFSPEAGIFATVTAAFTCAIDTVASSLGYTLDPLFWCSGAWGTVYPLSGNSSHSGNSFAMNNSLAAKFLYRQHRLGLAQQTIGPTAVCNSHPNPIWVKSQYRFNQVLPIARRGKAVATGGNGWLQFPPVHNVPTQEHTVNLIWQGMQCCLKGIP